MRQVLDSIPTQEYEIFNFLRLLDKARNCVSPLNTPCLQNSAESGQRKCINGNDVLTLDTQVSFAYPVMRWTQRKMKKKW